MVLLSQLHDALHKIPVHVTKAAQEVLAVLPGFSTMLMGGGGTGGGGQTGSGGMKSILEGVHGGT